MSGNTVDTLLTQLQIGVHSQYDLGSKNSITDISTQPSKADTPLQVGVHSQYALAPLYILQGGVHYQHDLEYSENSITGRNTQPV
jgi:hypothetical protein